MERICFLGYSEPDGQSFGNGVVRVIYNQARILRKRGYEVYFYHLFSSEEYKHLNTFLRENNIDLAFWHMTTLKVKRHIHLVCPLVCLWHSTPFFLMKITLKYFVRNIMLFLGYGRFYAANG